MASRLIFLSLLFSSTLLALTVPERPAGRVSDAAGILQPNQRVALEFKLARFEQESSNQIVVATFSSLDGESLEGFSVRLAEKWKVGQQGRDNGIILLIFPNDRRLRIEVGYGLESSVPDAYASRIIEEKLKPAFREGNYYAGIDAAVDSLIRATQKVYDPLPPHRKTPPWSTLVLLFGFPLLFLFSFVSQVRRYGLQRVLMSRAGWTLMGGSGGFTGGWGGGGGGFSGGGGGFGGGGSSGSW